MPTRVQDAARRISHLLLASVHASALFQTLLRLLVLVGVSCIVVACFILQDLSIAVELRQVEVQGVDALEPVSVVGQDEVYKTEAKEQGEEPEVSIAPGHFHFIVWIP